MVKAPYRRLVLGLGPGHVDKRMLRATVEFARLLELEMLGVFVEDQALLGLAGLPFARELRLPDYAWQPIEAQRVAADLRAAAEQARKMFDRESTAQGIACRFEIRRGDPATLVCSLVEESDIIVVAEPRSAIERVTAATARAQTAAAKSPAAVLFLPPSAHPTSGPVAVFAASAADPASVLASRIAAAAGEDSILISPPKRGISDPVALLSRALGYRHERLIILARGTAGTSDETPPLLVAERNVPVLSIEPVPPAKKR